MVHGVFRRLVLVEAAQAPSDLQKDEAQGQADDLQRRRRSVRGTNYNLTKNAEADLRCKYTEDEPVMAEHVSLEERAGSSLSHLGDRTDGSTTLEGAKHQAQGGP